MKKFFLIFLFAPLFALLLSCNKEEKFPTKKDLKGHWVHCEGWGLSDELVFNNNSVKLIYRTKDTVCSKAHNYRLDVAIKKIYFTSGVLEGSFYEICIEKKSGLLYMSNYPDFHPYNKQKAIYKKK